MPSEKEIQERIIKALNAIGVDASLNILFRPMLNAEVGITKPSHSVLAGELISVEDSFGGYISCHEGNKRALLDIGDNTCDNLTVPLNTTEEADDTLPKRFFEEKLEDSGKVLLRSEFDKMLSDYYRLKCWD